MTESAPHRVDLAAALDRQRETLPWIATAESVVAPAHLRALLARLAAAA
jgi:hypothetical protein